LAKVALFSVGVNTPLYKSDESPFSHSVITSQLSVYQTSESFSAVISTIELDGFALFSPLRLIQEDDGSANMTAM